MSLREREWVACSISRFSFLGALLGFIAHGIARAQSLTNSAALSAAPDSRRSMKTGSLLLLRSHDFTLPTLAILLAAASVTFAQTYDPALEFSANNNPNDVWSYGYSSRLGGTFVLFTNNSTAKVNGIELDVWYTPIPPYSVPAIYHNPTTNRYINTTQSIGPGELGLHPGPDDEYSVVRFSAPSSGHYLVQGNFFGQDIHPTSTDVHVLVNGVSAFD